MRSTTAQSGRDPRARLRAGTRHAAQLAAIIRDDLEKWHKVVREANIRSE